VILPHVARFLLWLGGWTAVGGKPPVRKAVLIAAPHTSNWDGFWAICYKVYTGLDIRWFVKESMFWFPMNILLRINGAIPLNRSRATSSVAQAVDAFDENDDFYFGLAPEGTRSKVDSWKSGFYRIAEGANVPVVLGFLDYENKRLGLGPTVTLTGDRKTDMAIIESFYAAITGRWPEKTGPIELSR
jgi:1-acyl-sn-glycerol-3-phosphate acyltransferase